MSKISFIVLLLLLVSVGTVPYAVYLGIPLVPHLFGSMLLCMGLGLIFLLLSRDSDKLSAWAYKHVLIAIFFRLGLLNLLLAMSQFKGVSIYGFFDDEFYERAWAVGELADTRNIYGGVATFLGGLFGDYSALILRQTNIVLSTFVAFPAIRILQRFGANEKAARMAVLLLLYLPYAAAHSIFAIKDIISALLLTVSLSLIVSIRVEHDPKPESNSAILRILLLLGLSLLLEGLRTGQGFAIMATALLGVALQSRARIPVPLVALLLMLVLALLGGWAFSRSDAYLLHAERYLRWISTQVADGDFRAFFVIDTFAEVWKAPFAFVAYLLGPIPQPGLTGRVMIDTGGWLKMLDFPVLIFVIAGLWRLRLRLLPFFLPVLVPLLLSAIWNVTNFRAQIAYYPALFVLFGMLLDQAPQHLRRRQVGSLLFSGLAVVFVVYRLT